MFAIRLLVGLALTIAVSSASARIYDHIYANNFEVPADAPASDAEAARFLTQATFGPTAAEIARLRAIGYGEWMAQQLGLPPTLARPFVQQVQAARTAAAQSIDNSQRRNRWYWTAVYGNDQLRQRMAWALSQIMVVSDQSSAISQDFVPMTEYWDLLARDAFGTYRALLGEVTYSPTMGKYLSSFRNQKPSSTTQPDENYAREVMQLFSVGLILRNPDFSPALVGGNTVPTYDQTTITHTAKVFTGFTYSDANTGSGPPGYTGANFFSGNASDVGAYSAMSCWGTELFPASGTGSGNMRHDVTGDDGTTATSKTVLGGATLPPSQTCHQDVDGELNIISTHQNVAPFIARQLIQRFVTSNPSPAYIQRVASVFVDNGAPEHDYGDLGAVINTILLDPEARTAPSDPNYGKTREPLLRLTAMWRAWDAQPAPTDVYGDVPMGLPGSALNNYGQSPLGAPTVFNFYEPDYAQPGPIADAGLYSPELQIVNESTTYTVSNGLYTLSANSYVGMTSPPTNRPLLNLSVLSANAADPAAMIAEANRRMLYGSMSVNMQNTLTTMLNGITGSNSANEKAYSLVYLIAISPEYSTQR